MTKKELQKRILKDGKKIALSDFTWDKKTNTLSIHLDGVVVDLSDVIRLNIVAGSGCTFKTGRDCTFKTRSHCTFKTEWDCTFKTGRDCTFKTRSHCTFKTEWDCTFKTGRDCTFDTGSHCTFKTGSGCTFKTGRDCTFDTGSHCTFKTGEDCTFDTRWHCTFKTGRECTFEVDGVCSLLKYNEVHRLNENIYYEADVEGIFKWNGRHYEHSEREGQFLIADGIPGKILHEKKNAWEVELWDGERSFVVTDGDQYAHGESIQDAKQSLIYKISDRDTSKYDGMSLEDEVNLSEAIKMYRTITGACESETRRFVEQKGLEDRPYKIREMIDITEGQYGNDTFRNFFKNRTQ